MRPGTLRDDIDPLAVSELLSSLFSPEAFALVSTRSEPLEDYKRRMRDLLEHGLLASRGS